MLDLFGEVVPHDPGGKVRIKLPPGTIGDAEFYGAREEYRLWLSRHWGDAAAPYALWIGMNPSTADGLVDDPTVYREVTYTQRMLKLTRYMKCNVMDLRVTKSKVLRNPPYPVCSDRNLPTIIRLAASADRIIICYGNLHPKLQVHADAAVTALREAGHDLWCLGLTEKHKRPRHPLYVKGDTELVRLAA